MGYVIFTATNKTKNGADGKLVLDADAKDGYSFSVTLKERSGLSSLCNPYIHEGSKVQITKTVNGVKTTVSLDPTLITVSGGRIVVKLPQNDLKALKVAITPEGNRFPKGSLIELDSSVSREVTDRFIHLKTIAQRRVAASSVVSGAAKPQSGNNNTAAADSKDTEMALLLQPLLPPSAQNTK